MAGILTTATSSTPARPRRSSPTSRWPWWRHLLVSPYIFYQIWPSSRPALRARAQVDHPDHHVTAVLFVTVRSSALRGLSFGFEFFASFASEKIQFIPSSTNTPVCLQLLLAFASSSRCRCSCSFWPARHRHRREAEEIPQVRHPDHLHRGRHPDPATPSPRPSWPTTHPALRGVHLLAKVFGRKPEPEVEEDAEGEARSRRPPPRPRPPSRPRRVLPTSPSPRKPP